MLSWLFKLNMTTIIYFCSHYLFYIFLDTIYAKCFMKRLIVMIFVIFFMENLIRM